MRAPYSWLAQYAALEATTTVPDLAEALTSAGLQVEHIDDPAARITGQVVVGQVLSFSEEPQKNGKTIRWCQVDVGEHNPEGADHRGIVCGASNFAVGDLVAVALPGTTLPGDFLIAARKTYGHVSDGMICAEDELGLGTDHAGIIVLDPASAPVVGADALQVLGATDPVFEIDVTPDEGHCLSIRGLAREAAQILGVDYTDPYLTRCPEPVSAGYPVVLDSPDCAHFVAVTVTGLDPEIPTPSWMVNRLKAAGMRSVTLAVDITNYVMVESGQPLHAYDLTKLAGPIRVRNARPGERLTTLDHVERALNPEDLLITDDTGPIGLAGVMGGLTTEIALKTTDILLEAAWFAPASVGRTYRRHHLPSQASRRFERRVDPGVAYAAAQRAAELLADLAGGQISKAVTIAGEVSPMPTLVIKDTGLFSRILGVEVSDDQVTRILSASQVRVESVAEGGLRLTPPTWRGDLVDPYDYVEEVGRKIGFSAIQGRVPSAPPSGGYTREQIARRAVVEQMAGAGFAEVIGLPFMGTHDLDKMGVPCDDPRRHVVRIANPLSEDQPFLRSTLLPGLLAAVNRNTSRSEEDLALFECGTVFLAGDSSPQIMPSVAKRPTDAEIEQLMGRLPVQPRHLAAVACGQWRTPDGCRDGEPVTWQHAIYAAETVAAALGVHLVRRVGDQLPWHPGRCAELCVAHGDDLVGVGWAGELHPSAVEAWDLPGRTCAMQIDLDALISLAPTTGVIMPLSTHPATKQDVALIVDAATPSAEVRDALSRGAGELLESITLFDVYTGEQIGEGSKSLAYSMVFRAPDRTLTEAEASAARDGAVAEAARLFGAVMRG